MKIIQATPRCGPPSWHYFDSMAQWLIYHHRTHPEVEVATIHPARSLPIDVARNLLVEKFLETDGDYMWMLDQDAAFLPGTLDRLMSRRLPIVGATEMMRLPGACWPMALKGKDEATGKYRIQSSEVYAWIAEHMDATTNEPQILEDVPQDSLLEVGFTGCHCLLVRRDVLADMEPPWFQGYQPGGEDQWFCERAFAMGIPTYVDLTVIVGHAATDRIIGAFDFMAAQWFTSNKQALEVREADAKMREWKGYDFAAT